MNSSHAVRMTMSEASSAVAASEATRVCTMPPICITTIIANTQPAARPVAPSPTPRQVNSGR